MKTLTRDAASCQVVAVPPSLTTMGQLANEAAEILGYQAAVTGTATIQTHWQRVERSNEIRQALAALAYPPFLAKRVKQYKRKKAYQALPRRDRMTERFALACATFFVVTILSTAVMGVAYTMGWELAQSTSGNIFVVSAVGTGACLCTTLCLSSPLETQATWQGVPIAWYQKQVPAFALQTAVDLKRRFPELEFFVEELVVTHQRRAAAYGDPFLRADLPDGSQFYLEVWDEPGFIQERQQ